MSFGKEILKYKNSIIKDLEKLISIKSCAICNPKNKEEPYGKECKKALDFILSRAKSMGLYTKNVKNYAGFAEFGESKNYAAVLSHIDVVPANKNNGWHNDPFTLTCEDGRLYGRGVVDNKGPSIIALYCLKILKDNNILGNRKIRTIFGSGEECGMDDMNVYFENEPFPDMAFTPDSSYGIVNREKGILQIEISSNLKQGPLKYINAGTVVNAVADSAFFVLAEENEKLIDFLNNSSENFKCENVSDGIKITFFGKSAHASSPEKGKNAIIPMLKIFNIFFKNQVKGTILEFLENFVNKEIYGKSLGISFEDDLSGSLTLNIGTLKTNARKITSKIDIRTPISIHLEKILKIIKDKIKDFEISFKIISCKEALNVEENSLIIKSCKDAYKEILKKDPNLISSGGGTYARTLKGRGVSFGPVFPPENTSIHEANESIDIESFFLHGCVCLEAMKKMIEI